MSVGIVYVITACVCILQISLIYNRTRATQYKEIIDEPFCNVLIFFMSFCTVDMLWGVFFSRVFVISQLGFTMISYGFHSMGAISAYVWYGYVIKYTKAKRKERHVLNAIRIFLLAIQIVLLCSNLVEHNAFAVDIQGNYSTGSLRKVLYMLQYSYYFVLISYGGYKLKKDKKNNEIYCHAIIFSLVPLLFGIGQYIFYDVAMYSLGFMFSAFVIYSYNVTMQREEYLQEEADRLSEAVYKDAYTGLYNRCAYEEDLKNYYNDKLDEDYVYVSMDINGLKDVNDNIGHDAGDELIRNAAFCMSSCFGDYGRIYRTGGDEFEAILFVKPDRFKKIIDEFEVTVSECAGQLVKQMYISTGYVTKAEQPDMSLVEMAKLADKRMYQKKEQFYSRKGIDRRGQQQAFNAVCKSYTKILKVNLETGKYGVIQMDFSEMDVNKGYDSDIYVWLHNFATSKQIHEEDVAYFSEHTSKKFIKDYFESGNKWLCIYYRRLKKTEYKRTMLEIIRAREYAMDNQEVFLYVKNIDY